jgi:hypothetical protein
VSLKGSNISINFQNSGQITPQSNNSSLASLMSSLNNSTNGTNNSNASIMTSKPQLSSSSSSNMTTTSSSNQTVKSLLTNSSSSVNPSIISIHSAPSTLTGASQNVVQQAVPINVNSSLSQVLRQFSNNNTTGNIQTITTIQAPLAVGAQQPTVITATPINAANIGDIQSIVPISAQPVTNISDQQASNASGQEKN